MIPCSQMQCNRRTQELGFSRSLREARDLRQHPGEALKTFRICPEAAAMQLNDRSRGLPRRITKQSKGCQLASLRDPMDQNGESAPSSLICHCFGLEQVARNRG